MATRRAPQRSSFLSPLFLLLVALTPALARAEAAPRQVPHKKVILFLGMPGAGKSTAAKRLANRLGDPPRWTSGDVIRAEVKRRGLPDTAQSDRLVAEEFGRTRGEVGRRIAAAAAEAPGQVAIVEGLRTTADLDRFQEVFPDATIVAVEVGTARRHARMLERGRTGEDNLAYLRDRDRSEVRRGVRAAMQRATVRIRPRGDSMEALDRSLERIVRLTGVATVTQADGR